MTMVAFGGCCVIIVKLLVIIVIFFNSRTVRDWKTRREGFTHYLLIDTSLSGVGGCFETLHDANSNVLRF